MILGERTHDKLERARALLSHAIPRADDEQVVERALDALMEKLERQKFARTERPRRDSRPARAARTIPAAVRRAVWARDGGRCTFVGPTGHRCDSRTRLEFDHVVPVALGGRATVDGVRLRCRGHNQHEAEQVFGKDFMRRKRENAARGLTRLAAPPP